MSLGDCIKSLDDSTVETAFADVIDIPRCGNVENQIVAQDVLKEYPSLKLILRLIDEENDRRGIPKEHSSAILLGSRIVALTLAKAAEQQRLSFEE